MYLQMGMSLDEYWKGPPYLAVVYRELNTNKRKEKNEYLWLQGMYIYEAFSTVMYNAFRGKGKSPAKYTEKPYRITPETEEEKREKAEAERKKAISSLTAWKAAWDRKNG